MPALAGIIRLFQGYGRLHDGSAMFTGTFLFVLVKGRHGFRQLIDDVFQIKVLLVQQLVAAFAIPLEAVLHARTSLHFHDQPDRIGTSLRGMRSSGRQKKDLAFFDRDVHRLAVVDDLDQDVALELIEKLFRLVVMVILAAVGAANDHDNEILVGLIDDLIHHRRLEQVTVFVDPLFEVERAGYGHGGWGLAAWRI